MAPGQYIASMLASWSRQCYHNFCQYKYAEVLTESPHQYIFQYSYCVSALVSKSRPQIVVNIGFSHFTLKVLANG